MPGRKTKLAKTRLDKYYKLAKEQGYRSRAAFKLIQLNKSYDLLSKAKVVIDLCAAPGSWMQVASKYMPLSSILVGIDLDPIKPIKNAHSIQGDITTAEARNEIKKIVQTWKADLVLHDGAPNVGKAWAHDAFSQAELVLHSLKLATEFLRAGGNFVTKIFRSADYNSLLWVFKQLFKRVEATKPKASRDTSAEIFVVCLGYLDPKTIDPKMLDPKFVFRDIDAPIVNNVFQKQSKRPPRIGYEEGNTLLFKQTTITDFLSNPEPVKMLGIYNRFEFDEDTKIWKEDTKLTNQDILDACFDLKFASTTVLKKLLKWREKILQIIEKKKKEAEDALKPEPEEEDEETIQRKEEEAADQELKETIERVAKDKKRKLRKEHELKAKVTKQITTNRRLFETLDQEEEELFGLRKIKNDSGLVSIEHADAPDEDLNQVFEDEMLEMKLKEIEDYNDSIKIPGQDEMSDDEVYLRQQERVFEDQYEDKLKTKTKITSTTRRKLSKLKKQKEKQEKERLEQGKHDAEAAEGLKPKRRKTDSEGKYIPKVSGDVFSDDDDVVEKEDDDDDESESDLSDYEASNSLLVKDEKSIISENASRWFQDPIFKEFEVAKKEENKEEAKAQLLNKLKRGLDTDNEEEYDTDEEIQNLRKKSGHEQKNKKKDNKKKKLKKETTHNGVMSQINKKNKKNISDSEDEKNAEDEEIAKKEDDFEEVKKDSDIDMSDLDEDEKAQALAIGTQIVNNKKLIRDLEDNAYHRFAFNDSETPIWFADEESQHNNPQLPVTAEEVAEMKKKFKELDVRPIKKVAEAKARNRIKTVRRDEQMKSKALTIAENAEMTTSQKSKAIETLYKKQKIGLKREKNYVVMKKMHKGKIAHGAKEKGKKNMAVDSRLKKDKRGKKVTEKRMMKRRK